MTTQRMNTRRVNATMDVVGNERTGDAQPAALPAEPMPSAKEIARFSARPQSYEVPDKPTVIIEASKAWVPVNLPSLWAYRELLYFLVWRDIKVRYKQTLLGALWAIVQPLVTMVIFTYFFGKLARIPTNGVPYP